MADLVNVAPANCRLDFTSTTALTLSRKDGAYLPLKIGGAWEAKLIPSAGVTVANTGLAAGTDHYVYAFDDSGTLTLEVVTTAYAVDADTGVKIKTGDASRTLVGFARTGAGTPGVFQAQGLGTLSWFNRKGIKVENNGTTYGSVAGSFPAGAEVSSSFRQHFVSWSDDRPFGYINASAGSNGAANNVVALARDTAVVEQCYAGTGVAHFGPVSIGSSLDGDETDHYITIFAGSSATVFINGNQTANQGTMATVAVVVQG
jgi:hypothetical protein